MSEHTHAYVAYCECGSLVAAQVDAPEYRQSTATEIARWVRRGYRVERVTVPHVREHLAFCKCPKKAKPSKQAEMFEVTP